MDIDLLRQLQTEAQTTSDFLNSKMKDLSSSFDAINQKTAPQSVVIANADRALGFLNQLEKAAACAKEENATITKGIDQDVDKFLMSLQRIQQSIKLLSTYPWKSSTRHVNALQQLNKVGHLQLGNLFLQHLQSSSIPIDLSVQQINANDKALSRLKTLTSVQLDIQMKEYIQLRKSFLLETLEPISAGAFERRGSFSSVAKSFIEQFPILIEYAAALLQQERDLADTVYKQDAIVPFTQIIMPTMSAIKQSISVAIDDLQTIYNKQNESIAHHLSALSTVKSDLKSLHSTLTGLAEQDHLFASMEELYFCIQQLLYPSMPVKKTQSLLLPSIKAHLAFIQSIADHNIICLLYTSPSPRD